MKKFCDAFNGWKLSSRDRSMRFQYFLALTAVVGGSVLRLSALEWAIWMIAIALVLISEGFNSCLERLADCITDRRNAQIGEVKDYAAGIVLLSSCISVLLALFVLWHHFGG